MSTRRRVLVLSMVGLLLAGGTIALRLGADDPAETSALAESLAGVEPPAPTTTTTSTTIDPATEGFQAAHVGIPSVNLYASATATQPQQRRREVLEVDRPVGQKRLERRRLDRDRQVLHGGPEVGHEFTPSVSVIGCGTDCMRWIGARARPAGRPPLAHWAPKRSRRADSNRGPLHYE